MKHAVRKLVVVPHGFLHAVPFHALYTGNAPLADPGTYTVHRPDHWALAGTGLRYGDQLGAVSHPVGYECDGCELTWKEGLPFPTHTDGTPKNFEVVATCPARWR